MAWRDGGRPGLRPGADVRTRAVACRQRRPAAAAGQVLDVACGRGRHALLLAAAGFAVTAVIATRTRSIGCATLRLELDVRVEAIDLEAPDVVLEPPGST